MIRICKMVLYMLSVVMAGTYLVSCTNNKNSQEQSTLLINNGKTQYLEDNSATDIYENFVYTVKDDFVTIKQYKGNDKNVIVPDAINNMKVKSIDSRCFENSDNENAVNSISIPSTVSNISTLAFYNSKFLNSIECYDNIHYVSEDGILYTSDMRNLIAYPENKSDIEYTMPDSVTKIYNNAFSFCKNMKKITLSKNLEIIPDYAFAYNSTIENIIVTDSVTHIGFASFCKCSSLKEITLPDTVENINDQAIMFCENLKNINVNSENSIIRNYAENIGINYCIYTNS